MTIGKSQIREAILDIQAITQEHLEDKELLRRYEEGLDSLYKLLNNKLVDDEC